MPKTIREGLIKRIHIDKHRIRKNLKEGCNLPVITVQTSKGPLKARGLKINGPSEVISSPSKPLKCGARCWMQTKSEIVIYN